MNVFQRLFIHGLVVTGLQLLLFFLIIKLGYFFLLYKRYFFDFWDSQLLYLINTFILLLTIQNLCFSILKRNFATFLIYIFFSLIYLAMVVFKYKGVNSNNIIDVCLIMVSAIIVQSIKYPLHNFFEKLFKILKLNNENR